MMQKSRSLSIGLMVLFLLGSACQATTVNDNDAGPDVPTATSIRGNRYCEILIAFFAGGSVNVQVWGTQGLNGCPEAAWATVDQTSIQAELGATAVVLNGPRHWLIDGATAELPAGSPRLFGTLEMQQLATISLQPGAVSSSPYVERTILRNSEFEFRSGSTVYELLAPDGSVYVMQSYAQIVDAALVESDLSGLASRLRLPDGWVYRTRTLDAPLTVRTPGQATVIQDDLQNSYSKLPSV